MAGRAQKLHIGCCGFPLAHARYFAAFRCVEIDSSFYQLPRLDTVRRWRAAAPAEFQFAMKAWQVITHSPTSPTYKRTRVPASDLPHCGKFGFNPTIRWAWDETVAVANELRAAVVLFQCPASFRPHPENVAALRQFFERAKRGRFQMGWEPRGEWEPELVARLCRELDLIHVVDPLQNAPASVGRVRYFRVQHRARHTNEELQRLRALCTGQGPTWCLFNNLAMVDDAQRFMKLG